MLDVIPPQHSTLHEADDIIIYTAPQADDSTRNVKQPTSNCVSGYAIVLAVIVVFTLAAAYLHLSAQPDSSSKTLQTQSDMLSLKDNQPPVLEVPSSAGSSEKPSTGTRDSASSRPTTHSKPISKVFDSKQQTIGGSGGDGRREDDSEDDNPERREGRGIYVDSEEDSEESESEDESEELDIVDPFERVSLGEDMPNVGSAGKGV